MCIRDRIESYRSKSEVVSSVLHNIDVFSIEEDESNSAFINYLHITNGAINQAFTFEYKKKLNESKEELLRLGIIEMRERYKSQSREIIEMCIRDRLISVSLFRWTICSVHRKRDVDISWHRRIRRSGRHRLALQKDSKSTYLRR